MDELRSTQEEADTRMLLQAAHAAAAGYRAAVSTSEDTDVFFFFLWLSKASSHVLCLSNATKKLEQHTLMCQESLECWGQNCVDLSLVSMLSLATTVTVLFRERAR